MRGLRYDGILASTALALILAAPTSAANAQWQPWPPRPPAHVTHAPKAKPKVAKQDTKQDTKQDSAPAAAQPAASQSAAAAPTATETPAAPAEAVQPAAAPAAAPADATGTIAPAAAPAVAAEPAAPPPDPLASLDPADRPIAEKIRDLLAAKSGAADKIFATKKERTAVEAFYQSRNLAPLWTDKGVVNARAKTAMARLKAADDEGLEAKDYRIPDLAGGPDALAEADLKLTQAVLTYARHLQAGRFPYTRVSNNNIELPQAPPDVADTLSKLAAESADAGKVLEAYAPQHSEYKKLKAALAEMRGKNGGGAREIPDGPVLKAPSGKAEPMEDARVPLLREKLGLTVTGDASDRKYDAKLAEAVRRYQKQTDIPVTGNLDSRTIKELNGPAHDKQIDIVIANMERWRWYPRDLGKDHVIVNQPEFMLRVYHEGANVWTTRVVIGKPSMQTPLLSETMKYITINPTWNVPPSIVHNEYLPALQQDPTVLARMGLKVVTERDGSVHIYQPPGDANALGRIRFNFPNRFLVYQHDTPEKHFFNDTVRAQSHGCMRVQDPAKYAEVLFNIARPSENWTADKVKRMFGSAETDIQLPTPIWVHLTYQSAYVDEAGKLQVLRDVYNLDPRTLAAIKSERGMVEPQAERKKEEIASGSGGARRVAAAQPRTVGFFEGLFGGGRSFQPQPMPPRGVGRQAGYPGFR
jgi:murein L,D-transpeptidase YcbB/YkuD